MPLRPCCVRLRLWHPPSRSLCCLGVLTQPPVFAPPCVNTLGYCIFYSMPLTAVRHVRKMRGGAQSHLLQADDGQWYVVKFRNNPQHRRILINELVSSVRLASLKISAPARMAPRCYRAVWWLPSRSLPVLRCRDARRPCLFADQVAHKVGLVLGRV